MVKQLLHFYLLSQSPTNFITPLAWIPMDKWAHYCFTPFLYHSLIELTLCLNWWDCSLYFPRLSWCLNVRNFSQWIKPLVGEIAFFHPSCLHIALIKRDLIHPSYSIPYINLYSFCFQHRLLEKGEREKEFDRLLNMNWLITSTIDDVVGKKTMESCSQWWNLTDSWN